MDRLDRQRGGFSKTQERKENIIQHRETTRITYRKVWSISNKLFSTQHLQLHNFVDDVILLDQSRLLDKRQQTQQQSLK
jgi:hypothetical protein